MKRFKGVKGVLILIVLCCLIVFYYFYIANRTAEQKQLEETKLTAVQNVLLRDLEKGYPPSPKEVVKYYAEITKCFYNEVYTEEELYDMAMKIQELYDEELRQAKDADTYLNDLKLEIKDMKEDGCTISNYSVSASTDVEVFTQDGRDCARLYCTFYFRQNKTPSSTMEVFILRKDDVGHWKILGWDLAE